jgi:hypothetical protein
MRVISQLCSNVELPKMIRIRQTFAREEIPAEEIPEVIKKELKKSEDKFKPGMKIAVTCGSRGIANIKIIMKSIIDCLISYGTSPFVVAAMGSHGGATQEGQKQVLADFGITEDYLNCPVLSSMETVYIGDTDQGEKVYIDKNAAQADGIVVCGRIKAHTSFRGEYESGLMKMMTVGLGKQQGADAFHSMGIEHMAERLPQFGNAILKHCKILCGLGIIENAYEKTYRLIGLSPEEIPVKEPELLLEAKRMMGKLYFKNADVIVVDEMGKNISGDGMDPNITGKYPSPYLVGSITTQHLVVLDLTEESHGNANGLGCANVTTRRLFQKLDMDATYPNAITSTALWAVKIPIVAASDKEAIQIAVKGCTGIDRAKPRIIRIKNTLDIEEILISEALLKEAREHPDIEILGEAREWDFNEQDNLF